MEIHEYDDLSDFVCSESEEEYFDPGSPINTEPIPIPIFSTLLPSIPSIPMNLEDAIIPSSHIPVSTNYNTSFNESENISKSNDPENIIENSTNIDRDQKRNQVILNESTEKLFWGTNVLSLFQVIIPPALTLPIMAKRQREINQRYEVPKGVISNFSDGIQRFIEGRIQKNTRTASLTPFTNLCNFLHNRRN